MFLFLTEDEGAVMTECQKQKLRKTRKKFIDDLNLTTLTDIMLNDGVITSYDQQRIMAVDVPYQANRLFLDILYKNKPTHCYDKFISCLRKDRQSHLADLLSN